MRTTLIYARIADRTMANEYYAVTEQVEVLYNAPPVLPASAEGRHVSASSQTSRIDQEVITLAGPLMEHLDSFVPACEADGLAGGQVVDRPVCEHKDLSPGLAP